MILSGTMAGAQASRLFRQVKSFKGYKSDFIVSERVADHSPNAFLIEQDTNITLPAHFHRNQQFQVAVKGGGMLGRHALAPLTVHYAAPQTTYGPIVAGDEGLWYFTLRQVFEPGAHYMPESAKSVDRTLVRSQVTSEQFPSIGEQALRSLSAPQTETVLDPQPNGLAAWMMRLPPNASLAPPSWANGDGRFYLVTEGTVRVGEGELPKFSPIWVSERDPFTLKAGPDGAEVVAMQFPAGVPAVY